MNKWKLLLACGALCATSQLALAGGPEMPPPGHSTIFIGIGGAYDYIQSQGTAGVLITGTATNFQFEGVNSLFGLSPAGQLGYEYFFGSGGFFGIKGVYNYTNKDSQRDFAVLVGDTLFSDQAIFEAQSMVQAMLEGGICINNNAFYLEGGYAALFGTALVRDTVAGGNVLAKTNQTFNGGVAGIGYRHYFWDVLSIDAVYSYALFAQGNLVSTPSVTDSTIVGYGQANRLSVQDVLFTVNYNFNF